MTVTEDRAAKPYGDVTYADPKNGKYPIDTEEHIRAAWSYINMPKNAAKYPLNGVTLESVKSRIRAAMKRIGAQVGDGDADDRSRHAPDWEQRRKRWAGSLVGQRERRSLALTRGDIEIRARPDGTGGTNFEFNGYAATFYDPFQMWDKWGDEYDEDVWDMAFRETLSRRDLDTPFLIGHNDSDIPMARTRSGTMRLATDSRGLHAHAPGLDGRNDQVRRLASAMERGDIDEMSIGYVCTGQKWSDDWSQRHLTGIDLHRGDVSVVALAANPATRGASMVALPVATLSRQAAAERRGNPVDQDMGDAPDYNPDQGLAAAHAFRGTHSHPHTDGDGGVHDHAHSHAGDADHDHDHGGDALVTINNDGVPAMEESQGAAASLAQARALLETRRRQLDLLRLRS